MAVCVMRCFDEECITFFFILARNGRKNALKMKKIINYTVEMYMVT